MRIPLSIVIVSLALSLFMAVSCAYAWRLTGAHSGRTYDAFNGGLGALDVWTIVADNSIANGGTGAPIIGFDLTFWGEFVQFQDGSFGTNIPTPRNSDIVRFDAQALAQDTHFLPDLVEFGPPIPPPTEGVLSFGYPGSGLASGLTSNQVAIATHDQAAVVAIAQLVVLSGTYPVTTFDKEGTITVAGDLGPIVLTFPEPSSALLAMLCSGSLILPRGRR